MVQEDVEAEEQRKTPQMQILERADKSLEKNNKNLFFSKKRSEANNKKDDFLLEKKNK